MFSGQSDKAFSQADKSDAESALVNNALDGVALFERLAAVPQL